MKRLLTELRFLEVSGDDFQRSFQQGRAFAGLFDRMIEDVKKIPLWNPLIQNLLPTLLYKSFFLILGARFLWSHAPLLKNFRGKNLLPRLQGLAKGSGRTLPLMYGMNAFEVISSQLPFSLGCSSLVFDSHQTASGRPCLAYNHDFPEVLRRYLFVRRSCPRKGYSSLSLTYPPLAGAIAGVNEAGLAVSLNHAYATDIAIKRAIPISLLLQECLDSCRNADEASRFAESSPVPNGSLMTFFDAGGGVATVEFSCSRVHVRQKEKSIHYTFNKYRGKKMEDVEIPLKAEGRGHLAGHAIHEHNIRREKRFLKMIRGIKKYSDQEIKGILSDHEGEDAGGFHTICRHDSKTASTIASVLIDPSRKEMRVAFGNPCQESYQNFRL